MSLYKRVFNVRVKFHNWLWDGSVGENRIRTWLAPKMPDYLADPYMDAIKDFKKHPENWEVVETTGPTEVRVVADE